MNYPLDLFLAAVSLQEEIERYAADHVLEWLASYQGSEFDDAINWLFAFDFDSYAPESDLIGWRIIKAAVEQLRAHVKADVYSGWGDPPASVAYVQDVAARISKRVRPPS